jgi:hypothetical protein
MKFIMVIKVSSKRIVWLVVRIGETTTIKVKERRQGATAAAANRNTTQRCAMEDLTESCAMHIVHVRLLPRPDSCAGLLAAVVARRLLAFSKPWGRTRAHARSRAPIMKQQACCPTRNLRHAHCQ